MIPDFATDERRGFLQHCHTVERRRYRRERRRAWLTMAVLVGSVAAVMIASCLYAVGYF